MFTPEEENEYQKASPQLGEILCRLVGPQNTGSQQLCPALPSVVMTPQQSLGDGLSLLYKLMNIWGDSRLSILNMCYTTATLSFCCIFPRPNNFSFSTQAGSSDTAATESCQNGLEVLSALQEGDDQTLLHAVQTPLQIRLLSYILILHPHNIVRVPDNLEGLPDLQLTSLIVSLTFMLPLRASLFKTCFPRFYLFLACRDDFPSFLVASGNRLMASQHYSYA